MRKKEALARTLYHLYPEPEGHWCLSSERRRAATTISGCLGGLRVLGAENMGCIGFEGVRVRV